MKKILHKVLNLLSPAQRRSGTYVAFLLTLHSLMDFFSLAFFLPLILLVVQSNAVESSKLLRWFSEQTGLHDTTRLGIGLTGLAFGFILLKTIVNQRITSIKARFAYGVSLDLAARVANHYLEKAYTDFSHADFSKEVNRMVSAPLAFANNVIIPAGMLLSESLVFLLIGTIIAWYNLKAFVLVSLILVPAYLIYGVRKKKIAITSKRLSELYPQLLKRGFEITEGFVEIKSFQREDFFRARFLDSKKNLDGVLVEDHTSQTGTSRVTELIAAACICAMLLLALATQQNSGEAIVLLSLYAGASFRIIPSVNRLTGALHQIRTHEHIVDELSDLTVFSGRTRKGSISFTKTVALKGISFHYPGQPVLLSNVDLEIGKSQKIALTGISGVGKSTLLLILLRFLKESSGQILIDGRALIPDSEGVWRQMCGYVPQKPFVLDGTIIDNIAFGDPAPDLKRIESLIDAMALRPWLSTLPDGLNTTIGEKGVRISGGQLQRLAIARALYRNPQLLLLDEVTTQLDAATETEIIELLMKASGTTTILMITHNPELLKRFDKVVELKDGTITERKPVNAIS